MTWKDPAGNIWPERPNVPRRNRNLRDWTDLHRYTPMVWAGMGEVSGGYAPVSRLPPPDPPPDPLSPELREEARKQNERKRNAIAINDNCRNGLELLNKQVEPMIIINSFHQMNQIPSEELKSIMEAFITIWVHSGLTTLEYASEYFSFDIPKSDDRRYQKHSDTLTPDQKVAMIKSVAKDLAQIKYHLTQAIIYFEYIQDRNPIENINSFRSIKGFHADALVNCYQHSY